MFVDIAKLSDIYFVLDNLCPESIEELKENFGKLYKYQVSKQLKTIIGSELCSVLKHDSGFPVAIFGLIRRTNKLYCVYFLPTDDFKDMNKFEIIKKSLKQVKDWQQKYNVELIDYIYKKNISVMKWAELVGFKKVEELDKFVVYIKGNKALGH